jgi:glycosyltransferase involved in cell wall biosynthesis
MPTALVISRDFPPLSSAGASIRLVKFMKYIASRGWRFIVLTQNHDQTMLQKEHLSAFLENEIPPETTIIRIPASFGATSVDSKIENNGFKGANRSSKISDFPYKGLGRLLTRLLPRVSLWWGIPVLYFSMQNMKVWDVDLIYAVAPTFTNAFIGTLLSWFTGKPFIFDLKDDWVGSPDFQRKPAWRRVVEKELETIIIKTAAQVVLVTERSYNLYKKRYSAICDQKKFHFIPNGCDISEYLPLRSRQEVPRSDKFLILSAAWGYQKNYRDITPFFLGLDRFCQNNPLARQSVEVVLLGNSLSREYDELMTKLALRPIVKELRSVAREELVEWLWQADLFFLIQPVDNTTAISGTLYEYWAVGKAPILLIAETGASSNLVIEHHLGQIFHFDDIQGIANFIEGVYLHHQNKNPMTIDSNGIESFDRKTLALQMADIWQKSIGAQ